MYEDFLNHCWPDLWSKVLILQWPHKHHNPTCSSGSLYKLGALLMTYICVSISYKFQGTIKGWRFVPFIVFIHNSIYMHAWNYWLYSKRHHLWADWHICTSWETAWLIRSIHRPITYMYLLSYAILWGAVCVKTPILANIYETYRCLLNIAFTVRYLVNTDSLLAIYMRYLANIDSRSTNAIFSKHRLEMHGCNI